MNEIINGDKGMEILFPQTTIRKIHEDILKSISDKRGEIIKNGQKPLDAFYGMLIYEDIPCNMGININLMIEYIAERINGVRIEAYEGRIHSAEYYTHTIPDSVLDKYNLAKKWIGNGK